MLNHNNKQNIKIKNLAQFAKRIVPVIYFCLIFLFAITLLPSITKAGQITLPPNNLGLVGYWSFEDATGTKATDFSGNGNTGTLTNGPAWIAGKVGKAVSFDGSNDYVTVPNSSSLALGTGDFNVSMWLKTTTSASSFLLNKYINGEGQFAILINFAGYGGSGGKVTFYTYKSGSEVYRPSSIAVNDGLWHHLSFVRTGTTLNIYIDGVLSNGTQTGSTALDVTSTGALGIGYNGYDSPDDSGYTNGTLDDIRIYSRALSTTEISNLYNRSNKITKVKSGVPNSRLVGYWSFEDGSGSQARDYSGNGNTGTLTNMDTSADWVSGAVGTALDFDGTNDYVTVPDSNSLDFGTSDFSIAFWHKSSGTGERPIFVKVGDWDTDQSPDNDKGFIIEQNGTNKLFAGLISNNWGKYLYSVTSSTINDNTWRHFVVKFNRSANTIDIFINGVESGYTTDSSAVGGYSSADTVTNTYPMQIGVFILADFDYHQGQLDDIRIYDRALTTSEITSLYTNPTYSNKVTKVNSSQNNKLTNGLVGLWSFDGKDMSITAGGGVDYVVSGADNTNYNGDYTNNGQTQGGQPVYEKSGGGYYLLFDSQMMFWALQDSITENHPCSAYIQWQDVNDPIGAAWEGFCEMGTPTVTAGGGGGAASTIVYDRSGNNNTGTLTNGPQPVAGKIGQGLSFDGTDDYVTVPNSNTFDFGTGPFTFSAWAKTTSTAYSMLFLRYNSSGGGGQIFMSFSRGGGADTGKVELYTWNSTQEEVYRKSSGTINDGQWHHVVGVRDGGTITIYVDGAVNQGTQTGSATINASSDGTFGIGYNSNEGGAPGGYFDGSLDDVRVYNRALSISEIKQLYNMGR